LVLEDADLLREFGPRLQVGISIPTDDDTIRQRIEPYASAIPVRWTTAERLAAAGINVNISATPIFPMQNVAAYVRRCVDCGAKSAWAGRLRLIKNDPFRAVLQKHGWLHIFDEDFGEELKNRLAKAFPEKKQKGRKACEPRAIETSHKMPTRAAGLQPSLF
jgi:DNA repair photolyase